MYGEVVEGDYVGLRGVVTGNSNALGCGGLRLAAKRLYAVRGPAV